MTDKLTSRQGELLAEALGKCLLASGIVREDAQLTGPHLLLFADDLERMLKDLNTRPGAPVEGLEPVLYIREDGVNITPSHFHSIISPKRNYEALVPRSQAEAIIAAKEDERAEQWRLRREMEADLDTQKAISAGLKADNAALTARVKEVEKERDTWKANHDEMVRQNAVLRQRPDLPVDRIPAIEAYKDKLTSEKTKFEELDQCHERTIDLCNQKSEQIEKLLSEVFHDPALGITWKQICEQFDKECQHHQQRAEISEGRINELELSSKHSAEVASNVIAHMKALETQLAAASEENQKLKHDLAIFHKDNVAFEARAALEYRP